MPPSRSLYYLRFVFLVVSARLSSRHAINKLVDSPQHRIISCNAKQLNVQLERLMFCKDVYVVPCDITPSHFTQRYTVCMYAVPFYITLSHFTQRYTICVYAVPFEITLTHVTQRYTVCVYAVPFDISLSHFTQRYTICVHAIPFYITLRKLTQCLPFVRTLCYSTLPWAISRNGTPFKRLRIYESHIFEQRLRTYESHIFELRTKTWMKVIPFQALFSLLPK